MTSGARVLLTKWAYNLHDRGVRYIAGRFRDSGFEVVYTLYEVPEDIITAAIQEDVDVIGISSFDGEHLTVAERVLKGLKDSGIRPDEMLVMLGGVIPKRDHDQLRELGVGCIFNQTVTGDEVVKYVQTWLENSGNKHPGLK